MRSVDNDRTLLLKSDELQQDYGTLVDVSGAKPKQKKEKVIRASIFNLFIYTTRLDRALLAFGTILAMVSGSMMPILGLFFGGMTNTFLNVAVNGLIPNEVVQQTMAKSMENATPVEITYNNIKPNNVEIHNDKLLFKVYYIITEVFETENPYASLDNTTYNTPLTEAEFEVSLNKYTLVYLLMGILMLLFSFLQTICWEYTSGHQVHTIRQKYFSQIIRQEISWYDTNDNGNLPNKLADDVERIREGTGFKCVMIVQYVSTFVSGILVGLSVNWQLTLVILCVAPFLVALNAYTFRFGAMSMAREQEKYAAAGAVAEEVLSNVKTVNAFGGQVREVNRYDYWLEEGRKLAMKKYNILSISIFFSFLFMYGAYGIGFAYGSYLVQLGVCSPGSIFTVFFSVVMGSASLAHTLPFLNVVSSTIGVISSVHEIITRKSAIDPYSTTGRKPPRISGRIEFKNVSFAYPTRPQNPILNDFSLTIEPGNQVALVGSSGAGKSTIVSLILRFYDTTAGEVCLDNIPIKDYNIHWLRGQIGLVSQEPVLFGVSIADNIKYGSDDASPEDIVEAAKQANAHNFIVKLPQGYNTLVGDAGSQLSGGQKQRIAIARALVRDPKILLLDEATSALDAKSEGIVQDTLEKAMQGRTTVIVAHRLSTVRNADRICVMQNGKVVESGTHNELMAKQAVYFELVQAQLAKEKEEQSSEDNSGDASRELSIVPESDEVETGESSDEGNTAGTETQVVVETESANSDEKASIVVHGNDGEEETAKSESVSIVKREAQITTTESTASSTVIPTDSVVPEDDEETKGNWRVIDRQISSSVLEDDDDDEYETVITKVSETREILFDETEDQNKEFIAAESSSGTVISMERLASADENRLYRRRRGSSLSEMTEEDRKKVQFWEPEKTEKEISLLQLLKMQKPEWCWLTIAIMGFILSGCVTPIFALYYGEIFKVFMLTGAAMEHARIFWTYMFAGLAVWAGFTMSFQTKAMTEANEKLIARARSLVFQNIMRQPVGWFDLDTSSPGVIVNRLARSGPLIKAAAGMRVAQVLSATVTLIASFTVAFVCGWKLAAILAIAVPLIIFMSIKQQHILNRNVNRDTKLMDTAGRVASETVRNIRTVQALGQEKLFTELYTQNLEQPYKEGKKQGFIYSLLYGLTQGIMYTMYAVAFRVGGYLVETKEMTTDEIYKVFFALSLCANTIGTMFSYIQDYAKARHSIRQMNFLLTRKSEIDSSSTAGAKPEIKGKVEFKNVHFSYPTRPDVKVLRGLSFTVNEGKTLALVGESGCGKSTVISLLERFYDPTAGGIEVDGYDIRTLNLSYLRTKIGIVTQEPILFDTTIKENIAYGAVALQDQVPFEQIEKAARVANIHNFIMTLPERYDTMVGERGVQLSGGQKQRVAIARALIRDPKILLLDEATSALDAESEKIVQAALDEAKEGRTCIVVAHRLSTIKNADTICVVQKGKIVESGTHDELQALQGQYFQLTQRQSLI